MKKLVLKAIRFYQLHISPLKGFGCCIYTPTCSEYTRLAVEKYGVIKGLAKAKQYYSGKEYVNVFDKLFNKIGNLDGSTPTPVSVDEIKSSGYVVDTLEASVWCLLTTSSYKDCVLKAVNLGSDTDTVGAVAGGLAGALYGYDNIPKKWRDDLLRREYIENMVNRAFGSKI